MSKIKEIIKNKKTYIIISIIIVVIILSQIVNNTRATETQFRGTREQVQDMVVSTALSYYYKNRYSDYEQYPMDWKLEREKISDTENVTKYSKNYTFNWRNLNYSPEEISRSNYYNIDCSGFVSLAYLYSIGYDFSNYYNINSTLDDNSVNKLSSMLYYTQSLEFKNRLDSASNWQEIYLNIGRGQSTKDILKIARSQFERDTTERDEVNRYKHKTGVSSDSEFEYYYEVTKYTGTESYTYIDTDGTTITINPGDYIDNNNHKINIGNFRSSFIDKLEPGDLLIYRDQNDKYLDKLNRNELAKDKVPNAQKDYYNEKLNEAKSKITDDKNGLAKYLNRYLSNSEKQKKKIIINEIISILDDAYYKAFPKNEIEDLTEEEYQSKFNRNNNKKSEVPDAQKAYYNEQLSKAEQLIAQIETKDGEELEELIQEIINILDSSYYEVFPKSIVGEEEEYTGDDDDKLAAEDEDEVFGNHGHIILYVGNELNNNGEHGFIHSQGKDLNLNSMGEYDTLDNSGNVNLLGNDHHSVRYDTWENYFQDFIFSNTASSKMFAIIRPINKYCSGDSCKISTDKVKSQKYKNNIESYIQNSKARLKIKKIKFEEYQYKNLNSNNVVNKYNSVEYGDKITYRLTISNKSGVSYCSRGAYSTESSCINHGYVWKTPKNGENYDGIITITALIPEGTEYSGECNSSNKFNIPNKCTVKNDELGRRTIEWVINGLRYEKGNPTYQVEYTVNVTAENGYIITNDGFNVKYTDDSTETLKFGQLTSMVNDTISTATEVRKFINKIEYTKGMTDSYTNSKEFAKEVYSNFWGEKYSDIVNLLDADNSKIIDSIFTYKEEKVYYTDNDGNVYYTDKDGKESIDITTLKEKTDTAGYFRRINYSEASVYNKKINAMVVPGAYGGKWVRYNIAGDRAGILFKKGFETTLEIGDLIVGYNTKYDIDDKYKTIVKNEVWIFEGYDENKKPKFIQYNNISHKFEEKTGEYGLQFIKSIYAYDLFFILRPTRLVKNNATDWDSITYKVYYDGNGNTCKGRKYIERINDGGIYSSGSEFNNETNTFESNRKWENDTKYKLMSNQFEKEGYTFVGWSMERDGEVVYTDKQEVENLSYENNDIVTLYAKWEPITYEVHYNGNGATSENYSNHLVEGDTYYATGSSFDAELNTFVSKRIWKYDNERNLIHNGFTKEGYTFVGWSTVQNGKVEFEDYQKVKNLTNENNDTVMLYAKWKLNSITTYKTVTYNCKENGGRTKGLSNNYYEDYEPNSIVDLEPTCIKEGYTFVGWNTNKNAMVKLDNFTMPNNDVTLYGIYKKNAVTLKANFNNNGATLSSNEAKTCILPEVYNNDSQQPTCTIDAPTIVRDGYAIIGYDTYASSTKNNSAYNTSTKKLTLNVNSDKNEGRTWFAITGKEVTVTFHKNGNKSQTTSSGETSIEETVTRKCTISGTSTSCKIKAPKIVAANGFMLDGYSIGPDVYENYWEINTEKSINTNTDWYAQSTKAAVDGKVTFNLNNNKSFTYNGIKYTAISAIKVCTINAVHNGATQETTCKGTITLPTIEGTENTPTVIGWSSEADTHTATYTSGQTNVEVTSGTTLYAQTKKDSTTLKANFNANGATLSNSEAKSCTIGEIYNNGNNQEITCTVDAPTITRNGYTIIGWNTSNNATTNNSAYNKTTNKLTLNVNDDKDSGRTWYPITSKSITITFHKNGNKSQTTSTGEVSTEDTVTRTCTIYGSVSNCNITAPTMVAADGFNIDGYSTSANKYEDYWSHNTQKTVNANADWYAQSTKAAVDGKVTFNLNNNKSFTYNGTNYTASSAIKICEIGAVHNGAVQGTTCKAKITIPTIESPSNTPTVIGWSTKADNHTASYTVGQENVELTSGTTLYAQTKKNETTLKANFNENGATLSSNEAKTCKIGEIYNNGDSESAICTIDMPVVTREGYTIIGWNTNSNDTTNNSAYNISTNKLTLNVNDDINEGRTWYPISKPNRYKITFNYLDGNLNGSSELYIEYNSDKIYENKDSNELGVIPTATREEDEFVGWNTSTGLIIINANGNIVNNDVSNYLLSGKWIVTKNITLYAQYEKNGEPVVEDTFEFTDRTGYEIKDDIIYQIVPGMNSDTLFEKINTNGVLNIIDNNNIISESIKLRTGYKLRATFTTKVLEYKISVKGDVLGTGELSRDNARKIAKHVIDKNIITGEEYLLAADYNNNGKIKMNDVVKILREMKKQNNA